VPVEEAVEAREAAWAVKAAGAWDPAETANAPIAERLFRINGGFPAIRSNAPSAVHR
jgi:hypothetical protein